jgi:hypothetical protein
MVDRRTPQPLSRWLREIVDHSRDLNGLRNGLTSTSQRAPQVGPRQSLKRHNAQVGIEPNTVRNTQIVGQQAVPSVQPFHPVRTDNLEVDRGAIGIDLDDAPPTRTI